MVLACKFLSSGWFETEFADTNHPLLEILFEIRKIRNKSRHPAELNGTEAGHSLKFCPKLKGAVSLHFRVLRQFPSFYFAKLGQEIIPYQMQDFAR